MCLCWSNGNIYIRPIQLDLDTSPIISEVRATTTPTVHVQYMCILQVKFIFTLNLFHSTIYIFIEFEKEKGLTRRVLREGVWEKQI